MERRNIQMFLGETALLRGYRPQKFVSRQARLEEGGSVIFGEVIGVSPQGSRRSFSCLFLQPLRGQNSAIRIHVEYDESDPLGRPDMSAWFNSVVSDKVRVAEVLAKAEDNDVIARGSEQTSPFSSTPPSSALATASATALATPSPTPAVLSEKTREIIEKFRNSLVVVEGSKGKGSGFVCLLDGQPTVLTNAHVLAGNPQPRFTTMDGAALQPGVASLGVDHDICKLALPSSSTSFEMMGPADGVKIGDAIAVLGNSEGAGVIKPLEGTIVGIGPNLIEVSAPFVPGNSGSPIVHLESGKVIGIATYLTLRKVDENNAIGMGTEVRRFGYRLDSVKNWEPVNWARFYAQADQVQKILTGGEEFARFLAFMREKDAPMPQFSNGGIRRAVDTFRSRVSSRRLSDADRESARREFLGNLRVAARSDLATFDTRTAYDYFKRQIADETKFRDALYEAFSRALK